METQKLIGLRLKELRLSKDLSQEALAEKIGISSKYLSSIERGKENPTLDTLIKYAAALNVDIADLFLLSHNGKTNEELKAYITELLKDSDTEKLTITAKIIKAIHR